MKYVEQAIYDAKLPSITPQKLDNRTIKIPIPKYAPSPLLPYNACQPDLFHDQTHGRDAKCAVHHRIAPG